MKIQQPRLTDAAGIDQLVGACPPLDRNSRYLYLLLCYHHATTCAVALDDSERLVGFMSAYRVPASPDVLFVWQIAVHADARGQGLAGRMIQDVLGRAANADIRYLEATISPSNDASTRVFQGLAEQLGGEFARRPLFTAAHFGGEEHEPEDRILVGPFSL